MNSLDQYISLYQEHRSLLDSNSNEVMNSHRDRALDSLKDKTLPDKGSENYQTISLPEMLAPDFGLNIARINIDVNDAAPFRCGVPNMTSHMFFYQNDILMPGHDAVSGLPDGVFAGSMKDFCENHREKAENYYGSLADLNNPLVALNTLLAQDAFVVYVPDGVTIEKPLQLVSILENGMPLMALRRILIIAGEKASFKLLMCDHTQRDGMQFLNLQTIEVVAGARSNVELVEMEESSEQTGRLSSMYVSAGEGSKVSAVGITLYNGITRNEYFCKFSGKDASLKLAGMAIEDCCRKIDSYSVVEHTYPGCTTNELFKYVVDDESIGTFSGLIKVMKGASKTEAYQNSRNIIGNDGARVFSKPTLEIYDDDVKCSHGSAIGQLDEKQIFYMRTRGLSENEARFLLKQAFMADVMDEISIPDFRGRLQLLVEKRFSGESRGCSSCKKGC